jgi:hypothetical protein
LALADANVVTLAYNVSCVDKTIEFNVSGKTTGWLAIGFNDNNLMPNTDTYQLGVKSTASLSCATATPTTATSSRTTCSTGVSGELKNGVLTGRFKRKLDTGSAKDKVLSYAKPLFLLVASGSSTSDFAAKHNLKKASGSRLVQLFSTVTADTGGDGRQCGCVAADCARRADAARVGGARDAEHVYCALPQGPRSAVVRLLHRALLNIVLLFTLVGFVLITIERALVKGNYGTPHSYIGIVIVDHDDRAGGVWRAVESPLVARSRRHAGLSRHDSLVARSRAAARRRRQRRLRHVRDRERLPGRSDHLHCVDRRGGRLLCRRPDCDWRRASQRRQREGSGQAAAGVAVAQSDVCDDCRSVWLSPLRLALWRALRALHHSDFFKKQNDCLCQQTKLQQQFH